MSLSLPPALDDATAAQKLVYLTIRGADAPIGDHEIRDETGLAIRTIRQATNELIERDLVVERPCLTDVRTSRYTDASGTKFD